MVKYGIIKSKLNLRPKERIIKYLLEHKHPLSIREISRAISLDYKNTYTIINKSTIISKDKIGNTNLIKLNISPNEDIFSTENKRTLELIKKHKKIELIKQDIESVNYPFIISLIFGSYSKGTENNNSDIDLCIICDNTEKVKEIASKLNLLPFKIEIHDFTTKEFFSMLETTQNNVGKEIVKNNIILFGIENYYNLVKPWTKIK